MMIKKNLMVSLVILAVLAGCGPANSGSGDTSDFRKGTEGLVINFLADSPQSKIYSDAPYDVEIPISIEVKNKGAYPTPENGEAWEVESVIFISGFDKSLMDEWKLEDKDLGEDEPKIALDEREGNLKGKSMNNPDGGYDILEFTGTLDLNKVDVEEYKPNFLVTACYDYKTIASPTVCVDPRPFTTVKEKKVCEIEDVSLSNQGAPIAVTKIESKALSNSIQYRIHIKNVGKGDVFAIDNLEKCSEKGDKLKNAEIEVVKVVDVKVGDRSIYDDCGQLIDVDDNPGYVRLANDEGYVVCNLKDYKYDIDSAYTTPLYVELKYGYRNTISKEVQVIKVPEPN